MMFDAPSRAIELYEFGCITKKELAPQLCCSVCKSCFLDPMPGCILRNYIITSYYENYQSFATQTVVMLCDLKEAVLKHKIN